MPHRRLMLLGVGADEAVVERIVLDTVRATVAEVNPTCHTTPRLDTALERELGLDSLVRAELLLRLETALDVRLPDRVVSTAETPRDLVAEALRAEPATFAAPSVSPVLQGRTTELPETIRTLVDALEWHASVHPDRVHVRVLGDDPDAAAEEVTYGRLRVRACTIAAGLAASDIRPGDTVALMLPTSVDYFAAFFGVLFAGAVPVPLYPPMRAAQLDDYLRRQIGILDNARAVVLVTSIDAERVARALRAPLGSRCRVTTVAELERERSGEVRPPVRADDVALLQYTSGSTGSPKGVVLTHADLLANIRAMARAARADASDLFVSWLPLYHDMGLIGAWLGSLCVGFPLVLMSPVSFLVRPARWLRAVGDYHATLSASPNFGFDLCARRPRDDELVGIELSSLRMVFNGAEPVSADSLDRFLERFAPYGLRPEAMAPVYGLAEAAVGLAFPPPGRPPLVDEIARDSLARTGRAEPVGADALDRMRVVGCGRPLPGYEIRVVDRAGHVLGERREGRVEFRGPSATQGYYRNPEETRRLFDGAWLDTGDLGYMADGDIFLTGRAKDLIIRAGRNLHPEELENAVGAIPGVRRGCVAVFAMPDPESGTERLVVAAETHVHDPPARDQLRAAIVDVTVDVLGTPADDVLLLEPRTVPKTSSGKVRRAACRDLHREGQLTRPRRHPRLALARLEVRSWVPRARDVRHAVVGLAYAGYSWSVMIAFAGPAALALFIVPRRSWRLAVVRRGLGLLAHLTRTPVTVSGREHLAALDGAVVVANHPSWIDGAVLAAILPGSPVFVVAGELARHLWSGPLLRRIGVEFVERATHEQGADDTRRFIAAARAGRTLVVFPEGRLSHVPGLRAFRLGAFLAAAEARVPVVPVSIRGTRSVLLPGRAFPRHGAVFVDVGEPIVTDQPGWDGAVELQQAARKDVLARCGEPDIA